MSYTVNTLHTMTRSCEMMRDCVKSVVFKPENRKVLELTDLLQQPIGSDGLPRRSIKASTVRAGSCLSRP